MLKNYFKTAFRNLKRNKLHAFVNIAGLSAGMAVAIIIGMWIWDEVSFDKNHTNYNRIAQVMQHVTNNGEVQTWGNVPFPLGEELRKNYGSDFKEIMMVGNNRYHLLELGDKKFNKVGFFIQPQAPEVFSLKMIRGSRDGLKDPSSILLSESVAKTYFGDADPMGKVMQIDKNYVVKVTGVYEDLPANSTLANISFMAPWELYSKYEDWFKNMSDPWRPNAFQIYVQLNDNADIAKASYRIKDAKLKNVNSELQKKKPALFLHPMAKWHLYSEFKNGVNTGGRITYVWLFATIGIFVLLLACINFMNLSTARSEKRAKEVGIRKAIGSMRVQLIGQFMSEAVLMTVFSLVLALILAQLVLPFFNEMADKKMAFPWNKPYFWIAGIGFSLLTAVVAGSYPALYLSSFKPVKVLKGSFKAGKLAIIPRKVLVVVQFTVSVVLIIGTITVFRQIQFAKNRPVGYESNGLISSFMLGSAINDHFDAVKTELVRNGAIVEMAKSESPLTETWNSTSGIKWKGKDPNLSTDFPVVGAGFDYGKTIGWEISAGRDFKQELATDSTAAILNEAAVQFMGLKNPVGEIIDWNGQQLQVIGVVKNMIMRSPYDPVRPILYFLGSNTGGGCMIMKLNPNKPAGESLAKIETVFKKFNPEQPFEYQFVDEAYAGKFSNEQRVGKLAGSFALLAILISCLGIFGLASFVAEQRTKEIGVRKVLGASVFNCWKLLSKDFLWLVCISLLIATPLGWYFMNGWLQNFEYRAPVSWWVFAIAGFSALIITLVTVSFQSIKAAMMNPVKSLRSE
jgi:putative ABC transport system permease protein